MGELLSELDRAAPSDVVAVCAGWLERHLSAQTCQLLLADYSEASLEPVPQPDGGADGPPVQDVVASEAGVAYREQRPVQHVADGPPLAQVVHLPVSSRTERLGVLTVTLPGPPPSPAMLNVLDDVARVLGHVVTGARRYTDRFEIVRRQQDLGLAAEIQWELLPGLVYELPDYSIAGVLEPAYDIGGDSFDYAVSAHRLTVSITDAVGRGVRAALLAHLACTAMRNARRAGRPIHDQALAANHHLTEQFPGSSFVTGVLAQFDVATGTGTIINAGHPPPLLLRDGKVSALQTPPDVPLGLWADTTYHVHRVQLLRGDRVLFLTDGITEARPGGGEEDFGDERTAALLVEKADLTPAEFVRELIRSITTFREGDLTDDATTVCLDWHPPGVDA